MSLVVLQTVRMHLNIPKWLVFGGSWGSTLGLDYALRSPDVCHGLIVRGIYLNTEKEFDAIYARSSFDGNKRRQREFDIFFELAAEEAERRGEPPLGPDESRRFIQIYMDMISAGDAQYLKRQDAIWRFYAFECNLMEEDQAELLDPYKIDYKLDGTKLVPPASPEAQSVSRRTLFNPASSPVSFAA